MPNITDQFKSELLLKTLKLFSTPGPPIFGYLPNNVQVWPVLFTPNMHLKNHPHIKLTEPNGKFNTEAEPAKYYIINIKTGFLVL